MFEKIKENKTKFIAFGIGTGTALCTALPAFADGTAPSAAASATEGIGVVKAVMGLFNEFPLNIIIAGVIVGVGFGIFRKAKKSANG